MSDKQSARHKLLEIIWSAGSSSFPDKKLNNVEQATYERYYKEMTFLKFYLECVCSVNASISI